MTSQSEAIPPAGEKSAAALDRLYRVLIKRARKHQVEPPSTEDSPQLA